MKPKSPSGKTKIFDMGKGLVSNVKLESLMSMSTAWSTPTLEEFTKPISVTFTPLGAELAARAAFNPLHMQTIESEPEYLPEKVMAIFLDGPAKDIFVWIPSAAGRAYEVFDLAPKHTIYKADPRSPQGLLFYRLHRID